MKNTPVFNSLFFLILISLSGCAIHENGPKSCISHANCHEKLKSVRHWEVIAEDITQSVAPAAISRKQPISVLHKENNDFGKVFSSYIKSKLHEKGVEIVENDKQAMKLETMIHLVRHADPNRYKPGSLTFLGTGIYAISEYSNQLAGIASGGLILGDLIFSSQEKQKNPSMEVVITISIKKDGLYLFHETHAYFIDYQDENLFENVGSSRELQVIGTSK